MVGKGRSWPATVVRHPPHVATASPAPHPFTAELRTLLMHTRPTL